MSKTVKTAPLFALLNTQTAINAEIKALHVIGATYQQRVHVLACSVLAHVGKHGDTRPVTAMVSKMIEAMPDMVRVNSLKAWFEAFGKITFDKDVAGYAKSKTQRLGEAMEKPFWKFKSLEGVVYEPLVFGTWADKQIKLLQKDAEKTGRNYDALILQLKTFKAGEPVAAVN